jgi:hypothetical protein
MPISAELVLANLRELPHGQRIDVAVACDAMAVHAWPDGTVNGLNVPMHVDPALAAQRVADPDACARLVGGVDGASIPVNYLHLTTLISVVPGVPTMVLEMIPAAHGTATSFVTEAMSVHVHEVNRDGGRVICACSDCDSTCVQKFGEGYDVLADPGAYDQANADGGVDAPTPPALERPWPSPEGTAAEPLFPFDAEPPERH